MTSAFNPKVSLLEKLAYLASFVNQTFDEMAGEIGAAAHDPEVTAWLDRMAELEYITGIPPTAKAQGYQICATDKDGQPCASYCEQTTPGEALAICVRQFPVEQGYTGHSVRNIESKTMIDFKPGEVVRILIPEGSTATLSLLDVQEEQIECSVVITEPSALSLEDD